MAPERPRWIPLEASMREGRRKLPREAVALALLLLAGGASAEFLVLHNGRL